MIRQQLKVEHKPGSCSSMSESPNLQLSAGGFNLNKLMANIGGKAGKPDGNIKTVPVDEMDALPQPYVPSGP